MLDEITIPDLGEADALLADLLKETEEWGGTLAGGERRNLSVEAIAELFTSRVSFGYPRLVQLTEEIFGESGAFLAINLPPRS